MLCKNLSGIYHWTYFTIDVEADFNDQKKLYVFFSFIDSRTQDVWTPVKIRPGWVLGQSWAKDASHELIDKISDHYLTATLLVLEIYKY